ncbi:glucokinase [Bailinhaonella thermotolerans]|uniref:glucokinase n=1 Tax=Bailinhaonella thermotolerans TaxID=1070861 RepID=UPI00192A417E|nr:glucokinase [Bailinhaonella thermotolerans]
MKPTPERPWLVADIGGTNARFGLIEGAGEEPRSVAVLHDADHAGLTEAVAAYLAEHARGVRPVAGCVAMAGPVDGDRYRLTNAGWSGSITDTARALGIERIGLLNDFEALAMSLPRLKPSELVRIGGPGLPPAGGIKAVLGPGTGLGVAGLVPAPVGGWVPIPGEGGHVSVPAITAREVEVVRALRGSGFTPEGALVAENLLSGPGLSLLHRGLALVDGVADAPVLSAAEISTSSDPCCVETVEVFCGLLGTFAGNVALTLGARGGVFLGGGVLPRIAGRLAASDFRRRFEDTPRLEDYLAAIATVLIVAPLPALAGTAAWLEQNLETP